MDTLQEKADALLTRPLRQNPPAAALRRRAQGRRRRRMVVVGAACTAIVLCLGVVVVNAGGDQPIDVATGPTDTTAAPPTAGGPAVELDPLLLPSSAPDDLPLWSLRLEDTSMASPGKGQLFASTDDPNAKVLVMIGATSTGPSPENADVGQGPGPSVRATTSTASPGKDWPLLVTDLLWDEALPSGDSYVGMYASVAGMSVDDAAALLGELTWRSASPPTDSSHRRPAGSSSSARPRRTKARRCTRRRRSSTRTTRSPPPASSPSAATPPAGPRPMCTSERGSWRHRRRMAPSRPTTRPTEPSSGSGPTDPRRLPSSTKGRCPRPSSRATLASMTATSGPDQLAFLQSVDARIADLPLVGSATLPSGGNIEVHDTGGTPAVCLTLAGHGTRCGSPLESSPTGNTNVIIDGTWYAAVLDDADWAIFGSANPGAQPLPSDAVQAGPYEVLVAAVPWDAASGHGAQRDRWIRVRSPQRLIVLLLGALRLGHALQRCSREPAHLTCGRRSGPTGDPRAPRRVADRQRVRRQERAADDRDGARDLGALVQLPRELVVALAHSVCGGAARQPDGVGHPFPLVGRCVPLALERITRRVLVEERVGDRPGDHGRGEVERVVVDRRIAHAAGGIPDVQAVVADLEGQEPDLLHLPRAADRVLEDGPHDGDGRHRVGRDLALRHRCRHRTHDSTETCGDQGPTKCSNIPKKSVVGGCFLSPEVGSIEQVFESPIW